MLKVDLKGFSLKNKSLKRTEWFCIYIASRLSVWVDSNQEKPHEIIIPKLERT